MVLNSFCSSLIYRWRHLEQNHEEAGRKRPVLLVFLMGPVDVFLLHHFCPGLVEKAEEDVELTRLLPGLTQRRKPTTRIIFASTGTFHIERVLIKGVLSGVLSMQSLGGSSLEDFVLLHLQ